MKYIDKKKIYIGTLILGSIILAICFYFRYSYIDIFGFERPLQLASVICASLGIIGAIFALIDGVGKDFRGHILSLIILNLVLTMTYPILISLEIALNPIENPYTTAAPKKGYSTKFKSDSSFIIEGELYKFPVKLDDFIKNGFSYSLEEKDGMTVATIRRLGESFNPKPTWFTDGVNNEVYKEFYLLEAYFPKDIKEEEIKNTPIERLLASVINNNRDFEIRGIKLEDSINNIKDRFKDDLKEDENNKESPIKTYYLGTSDGYEIKLDSINGNIHTIEIYK